tara:strand:+ start:532 stop:717 length:186 start_codon:yes stop_codon:yes gene_type:complete
MECMFPYNDTENAWISGIKLPKTYKKRENQSLILSIFFALGAALFSTLIPVFIYFFRLNLL